MNLKKIRTDGKIGLFPSPFTEPYDENAAKAKPKENDTDPWTMSYDTLPQEDPVKKEKVESKPPKEVQKIRESKEVNKPQIEKVKEEPKELKKEPVKKQEILEERK